LKGNLQNKMEKKINFMVKRWKQR